MCMKNMGPVVAVLKMCVKKTRSGDGGGQSVRCASQDVCEIKCPANAVKMCVKTQGPAMAVVRLYVKTQGLAMAMVKMCVKT